MLTKKSRSQRRLLALISLCLIFWVLLYQSLIPASQWITYHLFSLTPQTPIADSVEFFFYDTAKILLLLLLMVYAIAIVRANVNVERVRNYLSGKNRLTGYGLGALFGAITPFCSCSSIPLFLGFTTAGIPLGITIAFLITSPLINEIAVVLLWGLLGWKFTLAYITIGMAAGIIGGYVIDKVNAEKWLQPFILQSIKNTPAVCDEHSTEAMIPKKLTLTERHDFALAETKTIFSRVWIWVIIGVGVGALLHGFVPQTWFSTYLGAGQWWSVPASVLVGIPLYTNVTGIVPIMESLLLKGLPVGTTLAFSMSTVAASLPEILMLKQVMRWQLLALFLAILLVIFTLVGWFFNSVNFIVF